MKYEKILHENVRRDGTFEDKPGAIVTDGCVRMSSGEGCGLEGCKCSEGHWISIIMPRNSYGVVEGVRVTFDNWGEQQLFLTMHELTT